jgi:hypothetical protein
LTAKGLDALVFAMRTIADEGVNRGVGDADIVAGEVRTGETIGGDAFGCAPPALKFSPGADA